MEQPQSRNTALYDAVIILGSKPVDTTLKFPSHVYAALDESIKLYNTGKTKHIVLSGNYALRYDLDGQEPPFQECTVMADYLKAHDIPAGALFLEGTSKDTVANFYYTKRLVLVPHNLRNVLFIAADFRIERLRYLSQKILGPQYTVAFKAVAARPAEVNPTETIVMQRTQDFLGSMQDGDDSFLNDVFYTHPFYRRPVKPTIDG